MTEDQMCAFLLVAVAEVRKFTPSTSNVKYAREGHIVAVSGPNWQAWLEVPSTTDLTDNKEILMAVAQAVLRERPELGERVVSSTDHLFVHVFPYSEEGG